MDIRGFNKEHIKKGTVPTAIPAAHNNSAESKGKLDSVTKSADPAVANLQDQEPSGEAVIEEYLRYLGENDISKEDVFSVLDTIITSGDVYWSFDLLIDIPVVFKMRPAWVNEKLVKIIEQEQPKTLVRFSDIVSMYNLAGSLVSYKDVPYEVKEEADLTRNLQFVMALPFIMQNRLVKQMGIFDRVVAVATSRWAIENFTKPLSEK